MGDYRGPYVVSGTSAANAVLNVSAPATSKAVYLKAVFVKYSATVTQNVTVTLNSALGASFDITLNTIAISAGTQGTYLPAVPIPVAAGDTIDVSAPAGGGGVTSTIAIYADAQIS